MLLIGYARVSKADGSQTVAPQRDALLAAGVGPERIYEDLASGRNDARPGLSACLKALQSGNTLVVWKLDPWGATFATWSIPSRIYASAASVSRC